MIVLDRDHKSLVSRSTVAAEPVRVVLLSAGGLDSPQAPGARASGVSGAKSSTPSVIRVHGGQLDYSDVERKAVMVAAGWVRWLRRRARQPRYRTGLNCICCRPARSQRQRCPRRGRWTA